MIEDAELGRRHIGVPHQLLREDLAPFDLRRQLRRTEDAHALGLEHIDDAAAERILGADDGQADVLLLGEAEQIIEIVDIDRHIDAVLRGAAIARRAENALHARRLRELPDQGVFAPAFTDDEDLHGCVPKELATDETRMEHG
jgi:hypothetical protein